MNQKNILIIGASSDIAMACAHTFAANEFNVSLVVRSAESIAQRVTDVNIRSGHEAVVYELDIRDEGSRKEFFTQYDETPDVVLFCVGYLGDQALGQIDSTQAQRILDTNFNAAIHVLNPLAERLEAAKAGTIIAITSVAGDRGRASNYLYGAAKAGLSAYLSGLRNRLFASGVHVIDVKPGFVDTKMTSDIDLPPALTAQPDQVASSVFLAWKKGRNIVYVKPVWRLVMLVIRALPEFVFKRTSL